MTRSIFSRLWVRLAGAAVGLYVVVVVAVWAVTPWIAGRALAQVPKALPGFSARIDGIRFDPFRLALTVRGFALSHEKLGDLATCEEFYASVQPLDLLRLAIGLRELRLTRPRLIATIGADGSSALDYLPKAPPAAATPGPAAPAKAPFIPRVVIRRFAIMRAALQLESRLPSAPQKLVADPIDFSLENLSTLPDDEGSYQFAALTNRGEKLLWNGKLSVRPPRLSGHIAAEGLDASRETTAAPSVPIEIASGRIDAATDYEITYDGGALNAVLSGAKLSVRDLLWNLRRSTAAARGPFALEVGPARVELRAPLPLPPGARATLTVDTAVSGSGAVALKVSVSPAPLAADADLRVTNLPLAPFTALAPPPTMVVIDTGSVSLNAKVALASGDVTAQAAFSLDGFSLSDRASRRALTRVGRLAIDGIRASTKARVASIDRVSLANPYLRLFRGANGRTNLEAALGVSFSSATADPAAAASTAPALAAPAAPAAPAVARRGPAPWRAKLKRFTMSGGKTIVQDEGVAPAFALTVHDVSAELTGLDTGGGSTATFASKGLIEKAAFDVSGDVRLSSAAAWVDAHVKTDGVQLSAFSPYSIQVIGYKLDRGALNLDLSESLAERRILSGNKIVLDQLTLGDKVDSPGALKVPVKLGLAILKDRRGMIDLDVPISGSLDDPHFRLAPLILKTMVNLIVKAALSPFDALGAALGGGADLGHVAFVAGASALAPEAAANLDKVAQSLADRPSLSIGVRGAAAKPDAVALGDVALRRRLRGPDAGADALTPGEEKKMLALYAKTFGAAAASPADARAGLAESLAAGDADLRALALSRVSAIQDYLAKKGVAPARFFSLEASASAQNAAAAPCELQLDAR